MNYSLASRMCVCVFFFFPTAPLLMPCNSHATHNMAWWLHWHPAKRPIADWHLFFQVHYRKSQGRKKKNTTTEHWTQAKMIQLDVWKKAEHWFNLKEAVVAKWWFDNSVAKALSLTSGWLIQASLNVITWLRTKYQKVHPRFPKDQLALLWLRWWMVCRLCFHSANITVVDVRINQGPVRSK